MKVICSSLFRALCSIIVGVLLVKYPDNTVMWITVAIGVLFLLSGVISCATFFAVRRNITNKIASESDNRLYLGKPTFPIVGIGSLVLGALLAGWPSMFISGLMYVLGVILILGAINQFMALISIRHIGHFSPLYWVGPSIIFIVGLYVIFKPINSASVPLIIIGWCSLFYGVTEIINSIMIYSLKKQLEKFYEHDSDNLLQK